MTTKQGRKRTVLNGKVHEGFGETERSEAQSRSLSDITPDDATRRVNALVAEYRPSMHADVVHSWANDMLSEPLHPSLDGLVREYRPSMSPELVHLWASDMVAAHSARTRPAANRVDVERPKSPEDVEAERRAERVEALRQEYRPTMDVAVMRDWAHDIVLALEPVAKPAAPVVVDSALRDRIAGRLGPASQS
jgi:hypothetical protein